MASRDIVEVALTAPIDWGQFEKLVTEVLTSDDLPRLRKLGGSADQGADAIQEAFYRAEQKTDIVVQITSERAQLSKFERTVARLQEEGIKFKELIIVYQHPVSSTTRREIRESARKLGVSVDPRDQDYLISQLGKAGSTIFSRYFGSTREQVDQLLNKPDPLRVASTRDRLAMLATLGAFVVNPHARLTRHTLFQKTVLAALVSLKTPVTAADLANAVRALLPEESIEQARINGAVDALVATDECEIKDGLIGASEAALTQVGRVLANANTAYQHLYKAILEGSTKKGKLDNASQGYLERNLRRALLHLIRAYGPMNEPPDDKLPEDARKSLEGVLGKDLPAGVGRNALFALAGYVEHAENWTYLAPFVRAYSALALRNLDPVGRRWQQNVLNRSVLALDTDVVLRFAVDDLPEAEPLRTSLRALSDAGVRLVISPNVIAEVAENIARADRTYQRFSRSLHRMSPSMVDGNVWHVVVRGFYYAKKAGFTGDWTNYWARYFDPDAGTSYVKHLIAHCVPYEERELADVTPAWSKDLDELVAFIVESKEHARPKAEFRTDEDMESRARVDVRMALHLAEHVPAAGRDSARGYVASGDWAFAMLEKHAAWKKRDHVHILTNTIPELASFICGSGLSEEMVVQLLFHPVIATAAQLIEGDIRALSTVGVDMRTTHLPKLEWDLQNQLRQRISAVSQLSRERDEERQADAALELVDSAQRLGYVLDARMQQWLERSEALEKEAAGERERRKTMEKKLLDVALAAAGESKKGRRRAHAALRELGIDIKEITGESADPVRSSPGEGQSKADK